MLITTEKQRFLPWIFCYFFWAIVFCAIFYFSSDKWLALAVILALVLTEFKTGEKKWLNVLNVK